MKGIVSLLLFTLPQLQCGAQDIADDIDEFDHDDTVLSYNPTVYKEDKWGFEKKPQFEKKYRTVEKEKPERRKEFIPPKEGRQGADKYSKKKPAKPEFLIDEKWQLCQSISEDSVKDSLLKFGIVTHIIPDAEKFRKSIKTLKDSMPIAAGTNKRKDKNRNSAEKLDKKILKDKGGPRVKLQQGNYVGRSYDGGLYAPHEIDILAGYHDGSNTLTRQRRDMRQAAAGSWLHRVKRGSYLEAMMKDTRRMGTTKNFDQVPTCYGWRYLKALDALTQGDSADTEVLVDSVSDMLDMSFAESISEIITSCGERLDTSTDLCPPAEVVGVSRVEGRDCSSQCNTDSDCTTGELCCRQACGQNMCLNVKGNKRSECDLADQFMQCLYNMIDSKVCEGVQWGQHEQKK